MYRVIPVQNKLVDKKVKEEEQIKFSHRLSKAIPQTTTFRSSHFLFSNPKKLQLRQQEITEIQRQNRVLLQKISNIMHRNQKQENYMTNKKNGQSYFKGTNYKIVSKHNIYRKKQQQEVAKGNQKIWKKLKNARSQYTAKSMARDFRVHSYYKQQVCQYKPERLFTHPDKCSNSLRKSRRPLKSLKVSQSLSSDKILARGRNYAGGKQFEMVIYKDEGKVKVKGTPKSGGKNIVMQLKQKEAQKLIRDHFQNSYQSLLSNIIISNKSAISQQQQQQKQQSKGNIKQINN